MATIGNFTVNGNGFVGTVKTLALGTVKTKIVPAERTSDKAPDYRIFAGANIEFGAMWKKKSQDTGREYHSVKPGRPELPGSDLRDAGRGRRRGRPLAHLVSPESRLRRRAGGPAARRGLHP
ncbi:uncharacterized protein (DUF736 family) [Bradyrhizobium sp. i1.3.6]